MTARQAAVEEKLRVARIDLEDIDRQLEEGEIDRETHRGLAARYRGEIAECEKALSEPVEDEKPRSRSRLMIGAGLIVGALALSILAVPGFTEQRDDPTIQGVAADAASDPGAYSDETLEAVIRTYADDPTVADQIPLMRYRLAERYFERGEFQLAYPHYTAILETATEPRLVSNTLSRVAWIVWIGNDQVSLALELIDRAIEVAADNPEALYIKAQLHWCGLDEPESAIPILERLVSMDLGEESIQQLTEDLEAVRGGQPCTGP